MMIREHHFHDGKCLYCGAQGPRPDEQRSCVARSDTVGTLRPEPARREYAVDAFETIKTRLAELKAEALPKDGGEPEIVIED